MRVWRKVLMHTLALLLLMPSVTLGEGSQPVTEQEISIEQGEEEEKEIGIRELDEKVEEKTEEKTEVKVNEEEVERQSDVDGAEAEEKKEGIGTKDESQVDKLEEKETVQEDREETEIEKEENLKEVLEEGEISISPPSNAYLPKVHFGGGGFRSSQRIKVKKMDLEEVAPWGFYYVWDKTLSPITAQTSYMAYFVLEDGDYGFCLNPTLKGPEGELSKMMFKDEGFRKKCEGIATVGLSSGGIPGFSFYENFIFAQNYIWESIPMDDGRPRYEISFRYRENWLEINQEVTARFLQWKEEVDRRIQKLGKVSFDGAEIVLEVGKELRLRDEHEQLQHFHLQGPESGLTLQKEGNELILMATAPFDSTTLSLSYAASDYPFPRASFILQGPDDTYQDLGAFTDPYFAQITVESKETRGRVRIIKKDPEGRFIPGARFELSRDADFSEILEVMETDEKGALSAEYDTGIPYLYVREIYVPEPYRLDGEIRKIELIAGQTNEVVFINERKSLILKKTDEDTGEPLAGVKIEVTDLEGNQKDYVSNEQGEFLLEDLASGTYSFKEIKASPGYILDDQLYEFVVEKDGSVEGTTSWTNAKNRVLLIKKDGRSGKRLAGVELLVEGPEGFSQNVITDELGEVELRGLLEGSYRVKEVAPPLGYLPLKENISFSIDEKGNLDGVSEIINEPTSVVLKKVNEQGKGIGGASFSLYSLGEKKKISFSFSEELQAFIPDEKGEKEVFVNDKGEARIHYLPLGDYEIEEIKVPNGYEPMEVQSFKLLEKHSPHEPLYLKLVNKEKKELPPKKARKKELPSMGEGRDLAYLALVLFGLSMLFLVKKRPRRPQ